jgi:hypothetical protein
MFESSNQELNVWLHENLFRKCWHFFYSSEDQMPHQRLDHCAKCEEFGDDQAIRQPNPNYCENIADAWRVIDELRGRGWLAVVKDMPDGFPFLDDNDNTRANKIFRRACADFQWMPRANIEDTRKYIHSHVFTVADTPARAICEAAKKAVEADKYYTEKLISVKEN